MRPGDRVLTPAGTGTVQEPTDAELRTARLAGVPTDRHVLVDLPDGWRWFDHDHIHPTTEETHDG